MVTRMYLAMTMIMTAVLIVPATEATTDISCTFSAQGEAVELRIVVDKRVIWDGRLLKDERRTVRMPEGAFTVESQVYNPNLKTKETIRAPAHTESCKPDHPISVPLFPE
jgi:hypothetical protein